MSKYLLLHTYSTNTDYPDYGPDALIEITPELIKKLQDIRDVFLTAKKSCRGLNCMDISWSDMPVLVEPMKRERSVTILKGGSRMPSTWADADGVEMLTEEIRCDGADSFYFIWGYDDVPGYLESAGFSIMRLEDALYGE